MSKIIIETFSSDTAEAIAKSLLEGNFIVKQANIFYDTKKGLPSPEEINKFPLILKGSINGFNANMHIYGVAVGYPGSGPRALVNILKVAGFKFDEDDLLTKQCVDLDGKIALVYTH